MASHPFDYRDKKGKARVDPRRDKPLEAFFEQRHVPYALTYTATANWQETFAYFDTTTDATITDELATDYSSYVYLIQMADIMRCSFQRFSDLYHAVDEMRYLKFNDSKVCEHLQEGAADLRQDFLDATNKFRKTFVKVLNNADDHGYHHDGIESVDGAIETITLGNDNEYARFRKGLADMTVGYGGPYRLNLFMNGEAHRITRDEVENIDVMRRRDFEYRLDSWKRHWPRHKVDILKEVNNYLDEFSNIVSDKKYAYSLLDKHDCIYNRERLRCLVHEVVEPTREEADVVTVKSYDTFPASCADSDALSRFKGIVYERYNDKVLDYDRRTLPYFYEHVYNEEAARRGKALIDGSLLDNDHGVRDAHGDYHFEL